MELSPSMFTSSAAKDAGTKFLTWLGNHPDGYYINLRSDTEGMLHHANCKHVGGPQEWDPDFGDVTKRGKVCHLSRVFLLGWAAGRNLKLTLCSDCDK